MGSAQGGFIALHDDRDVTSERAFCQRRGDLICSRGVLYGQCSKVVTEQVFDERFEVAFHPERFRHLREGASETRGVIEYPLQSRNVLTAGQQ